MTSLINVATCVEFEKEKAEIKATNTAKRQRRFKEKAGKRRCASNVVLNMVVQQTLQNENPSLQYHDENGRPVNKTFLPSVADCLKFIQLMVSSFPDVVNMEDASVVIDSFKEAVATGRGKSVRARQYVVPIAKLYMETYHPQVLDVQTTRRGMEPVSSDSESDQDDVVDEGECRSHT